MTPSASDAPATLLREVRSRVPVDAAALLAQATPEDIEAVLRALPPDFAARIAAHLPGAADDMPEIDSDARIEALMAPAVGMLPPNTTVAGAVDWLSRCPEVADVTYLYVVAEDRRLLGMVVMRDLLLARPGQQLSDVMLHAPYDSELTCRIEQVVFTGQYAGEELAIAFDRAAYPDGGPTPAYFRYDTVAVENDSLSDFYLASVGRGAVGDKVHRFPTTEAAMTALVAGEVMAAMGPRGVLEAGLTEAQDIHVPPYPGLVRSRWTVGVAINHQHRDLGYAVDYAIEKALADGRIEALFEAHGLTFLPPDR